MDNRRKTVIFAGGGTALCATSAAMAHSDAFIHGVVLGLGLAMLATAAVCFACYRAGR